MSPKSSQTREVSVCRLTVDGRRHYPWHTSDRLTVRFSKTGGQCTLPDGTLLKKIKGGIGSGNFMGVENGDVYRVWR